jgi:hypothetical protein
MQDFNIFLLKEDSIVNMQRRMEDAAHVGKAFDGFAKAGEALRRSTWFRSAEINCSVLAGGFSRDQART